MNIDSSQSAGREPSAPKPATKPKPAKKSQIPRQSPSEGPKRQVAERKVQEPPPPAKKHPDAQPEESCHYAVSQLFPSNKDSGVKKEPDTSNSQAASSEYLNDLEKIYSDTPPPASTGNGVNGNLPAKHLNFAHEHRLTSRALLQMLVARDFAAGSKLLNNCTAKQRMALGKEKNFPKPWQAALNRRLLADVLTGPDSENHDKLFFRSENKQLIKSAMADFGKKHLGNKILTNPVAASHLFKSLLNAHPVFNEESFNTLSKTMSDDIDRLPETLIKELMHSLEKMTPDEKDHFLVSIRVMMHAFGHAKGKGPEQSNIQPRAELAQLFGQSIFQIPPLPDCAEAGDGAIEAAMKLAQEQNSQAEKLMQILLLPALNNPQSDTRM